MAALRVVRVRPCAREDATSPATGEGQLGAAGRAAVATTGRDCGADKSDSGAGRRSPKRAFGNWRRPPWGERPARRRHRRAEQDVVGQYRSASMGWIRDARRAGYTAASVVTATANPTLASHTHGGNTKMVVESIFWPSI